MPAVPSTAYSAVSQVTYLVRALLNDQPGAWATDQWLMPFVMSAFRKVQRKLMNTGDQTFINDEVLLVVPAIPGGINPAAQVSITNATPPPNQLPVDLIVPARIWERPNLSSQSFTEMIDMTEHGGLASQPQGEQLVYWEWRSDGIYFIGALGDVQIRLRYMKMIVDVTSPSSQLRIRGCIDAVAYITATLAVAARGVPQTTDFDALSTDALFDLANQQVRRSQRTGRRRRPYGSKAGGGIWY